MSSVSHYQLQHWAHQTAEDATRLAVDSVKSIGKPWTDEQAEVYRAGALRGAQQMIATLKLQSIITVDYR